MGGGDRPSESNGSQNRPSCAMAAITSFGAYGPRKNKIGSAVGL